MIIITFHYRYRKQITIGALIGLIIVGLIIVSINSFKTPKKKNKEVSLLTTVKEKTKTSSKEKEESKEYKVDIKGEINSPGIYSLKVDSRVIDVIEMAGGLSENADTSVINLSRKIEDEMVIIIYSREQVKRFAETIEKEKLVQEKCRQEDEKSLKNDACIESDNNNKTKNNDTPTGKISLNTATQEELMTLPGIGESKAKDIITYREQNGPFNSIEDITKVSGIGDNTLAQIKENITV